MLPLVTISREKMCITPSDCLLVKIPKKRLGRLNSIWDPTYDERHPPDKAMKRPDDGGDRKKRAVLKKCYKKGADRARRNSRGKFYHRNIELFKLGRVGASKNSSAPKNPDVLKTTKENLMSERTSPNLDIPLGDGEPTPAQVAISDETDLKKPTADEPKPLGRHSLPELVPGRRSSKAEPLLKIEDQKRPSVIASIPDENLQIEINTTKGQSVLNQYREVGGDLDALKKFRRKSTTPAPDQATSLLNRLAQNDNFDVKILPVERKSPEKIESPLEIFPIDSGNDVNVEFVPNPPAGNPQPQNHAENRKTVLNDGQQNDYRAVPNCSQVYDYTPILPKLERSPRISPGRMSFPSTPSPKRRGRPPRREQREVPPNSPADIDPRNFFVTPLPPFFSCNQFQHLGLPSNFIPNFHVLENQLLRSPESYQDFSYIPKPPPHFPPPLEYRPEIPWNLHFMNPNFQRQNTWPPEKFAHAQMTPIYKAPFNVPTNSRSSRTISVDSYKPAEDEKSRETNSLPLDLSTPESNKPPSAPSKSYLISNLLKRQDKENETPAMQNFSVASGHSLEEPPESIVITLWPTECLMKEEKTSEKLPDSGPAEESWKDQSMQTSPELPKDPAPENLPKSVQCQTEGDKSQDTLKIVSNLIQRGIILKKIKKIKYPLDDVEEVPMEKPPEPPVIDLVSPTPEQDLPISAEIAIDLRTPPLLSPNLSSPKFKLTPSQTVGSLSPELMPLLSPNPKPPSPPPSPDLKPLPSPILGPPPSPLPSSNPGSLPGPNLGSGSNSNVESLRTSRLLRSPSPRGNPLSPSRRVNPLCTSDDCANIQSKPLYFHSCLKCVRKVPDPNRRDFRPETMPFHVPASYFPDDFDDIRPPKRKDTKQFLDDPKRRLEEISNLEDQQFFGTNASQVINIQTTHFSLGNINVAKKDPLLVRYPKKNVGPIPFAILESNAPIYGPTYVPEKCLKVWKLLKYEGTLTPEQYVEEMMILEDNCPKEFFRFYNFVSSKQIASNQNPVSFKLFLEFQNAGKLKRLEKDYHIYLQKHEALNKAKI